MTTTSSTTGGLDIGRVIQELFAVLSRNLVTFGLLALILTGIPSAILYGFEGTAVTSGDPTALLGPRLMWIVLGGMVAGLFGVILQATIIYGTVSDLNDRKVSVADSLGAGLRAFLPLIGLAIVMGVAIAAGMVLLIVPGIMLAIAWCVSAPSYVVEQTGVFGAISRSAELTRGNRWRIFGLFVLYIVVAVIVQAVLNMVGRLIGFATIAGFPLLTLLVIMPLIQAVNALIASTGAAVLYVELRRLRDGVGPQGLAAIFD
ncbi:MAG: glycerophosphoryl diester phosphodiesterase membrane domain-containing protein [Phenylobacterium sp.]